MKIIYQAACLSLLILATPLYAKTDSQQSLPKANASQTIDLNKADVAALTGSFKGIGKKRAEAIVAYRDSHKGFKSLEELAEVKGLGQHFVDKNREQLQALYSIK